MKIEIYQHPKPQEISVCVTLSLHPDGPKLHIVDPLSGECVRQGKIAQLTADGLMLYPNINPAIPLPLDDEGRIKVIHG